MNHTTSTNRLEWADADRSWSLITSWRRERDWHGMELRSTSYTFSSYLCEYGMFQWSHCFNEWIERRRSERGRRDHSRQRLHQSVYVIISFTVLLVFPIAPSPPPLSLHTSMHKVHPMGRVLSLSFPISRTLCNYICNKSPFIQYSVIMMESNLTW